MFRSILIAATLAAGPAVAGDMIARQGADEVRLFDSPCVSVETMVRIDPQERDQYRKAQGLFQGQRFFGCWRKNGSIAQILWEDGDQGIVPFVELKPLLEI